MKVILAILLLLNSAFAQFPFPGGHSANGGGGGGTPALSGTPVACDSGGFNTTNVTCNYSIANSGDTVYVWIGSYAGADWTPSITAGKVTFTASGNGHATTPAGAGKFQALYFGKSTASGADTVTCGKGGTSTICSIMVFAFSNTSAPSEDKFNNANGSGTALDSGSPAATTTNVDILVGCGYDSDHTTSWTVGTSVAWTQAKSIADTFGVGGMCEYFITSSTGTYHADATAAAGGNWNMLISAVKPN